MTLVLAENCALVDEITSAWLPDENSQLISELEFDAVEYTVELSLIRMSESSNHCLNKCSNNGICKTGQGETDALPYCECFGDYVGADCSLITTEVTINEASEIQLIENTSTLL